MLAPCLNWRVSMAGQEWDTGGEFTGWASAGQRRAAKGPRTDAKADPPASNAHEQTANSEFATSVEWFDGQPLVATLVLSLLPSIVRSFELEPGKHRVARVPMLPT